MYVALSRVRSINGMFLTGEFKSAAIKSDIRALQEYERMRKESPIDSIHNDNVLSSDSLTFTLLNTRSLSRHAIDIAHDPQLLNTDILCLTETQLMPDQSTNDIAETLHPFKFIHNKCNDKFQSLSFCYKSHVEISQYHHSIGLSLIEFKKVSFSQETIRLLLVYRKNNTCLTNFYETLTDILQMGTVHIVLGDFNINAQDEAQATTLSNVCLNYRQLVNTPTHLAGATLDHVYIRNSFVESFYVQEFVKCVYFSDHDAIQFTLAPRTSIT